MSSDGAGSSVEVERNRKEKKKERKWPGNECSFIKVMVRAPTFVPSEEMRKK